VSEAVELEGGARFDYNFLQVYKYENNVLTKPEYHFYNVAGNVGAIFHAHKNVHIRVNYGSSWRPPHVSELYSDGVHHGAATYEIGDAGLRPERAHNFNLVLNYTGRRIRAEATVYYYYMQDFIYLQPVQPPTLTIRGAFPTFRYQQADVDLKGFDVDVEADLTKHLVLNAKAMMLWAWNYSQNDWLVLMPPGRYDASLTYNFKDLKKMKNMYLSANAQYTDRQWRAPKTGDYMAPPDAYMLFGLEGGCSVMIGKQQLDISVAVTNLFDTAYRDYLNRFRYFSDEMGRNVLLRFKWPFTIKN
jgi:iron complex outermembrane receptor protein